VITLIKRFLWDETAFVRYMRAILAGLGMAMHSGMIPIASLSGTKAWWIGPALVMLAFIFGAGDRNQSPAEIRQIIREP
jgi:hypothetical protein